MERTESESIVVKVPTDPTSSSLDSCFHVLGNRFHRITLHLPINVHHISLVARFQLMQWIITARHACEELVLHSYVKPDQYFDTQLENLVLKEHTFLCLLLSDELRRVDGEVIPRSLYRELVASRLRTLAGDSPVQPLRPDVALRANVIAVDSETKPRLGCPALLYQGGKLKPFPDFLNSLVSKLAPVVLVQGGDELKQIARLAYELFQNTDIHARHSADRELIRNSVRGISVEQSSYAAIQKQAAEDSPMGRFLGKALEDGATRFISVNVFDSGVGIPEHQRSRSRFSNESKVESDFEIISRCFAEPSNQAINLGRGLPTVRRILTSRELPGFLYLRSGTAFAYIDGRFGDAIQSRVGDDMSSYRVRGSLFSVILPFSNYV